MEKNEEVTTLGEVLEVQPLRSLESKHIIFRQPKEIYSEAIKAGHEYVLLGSNQGTTVNQSIAQINRMAEDPTFDRTVMIIKTKDGRAWCNTTHTALVYLKRYADKEVKINEIPYMIVDYTTRRDTGFPYIKTNVDDILRVGADELVIWEQTRELNELVEKGMRSPDNHYSIGDLHTALEFFASPRMQRLYREELNKPEQRLSE